MKMQHMVSLESTSSLLGPPWRALKSREGSLDLSGETVTCRVAPTQTKGVALVLSIAGQMVDLDPHGLEGSSSYSSLSGKFSREERKGGGD